jgi:aerobic-type carbon monoxide dehydrogenase small subunit (CoxS/CutS family)
MAKSTFSLHVNGKRRSVQTDPDEPLLWVLRDELGLTGAKFGCGVGICGSCSVLINGTARRSCVTPVVNLASNDTIVTVEGLARGGKLTRLQQAFIDHTGSACGFCTPGMVITATALLEGNRRPARRDIVEAMNNNLCRCGCYYNIIESIEGATARRRRKRS